MEYQEYISSGKLEAWEKVHGETKKKKDPNAPKKTPTAYLLFSNEVRSKVKEENPDLTFGETMKKIGEMWNTLDTEEKSKYDKLAADMKENSKVAEQTSKLSQSNEMKENVIEENA